MRPFFIRSVKTLDVLNLLHHLSMALKAGVPLVEALRIFEEDAPRRKRPLIRHLRTTVQTGHSFTKALETSPLVFPPIAIHLVRTGELSGTLQQNLLQVVDYIRKSYDLRRKIRGAMLYPTFVLIAISGLGLSIGTFVLPELIPLFQALDIKLPFGPRVLLGIASFFDAHGTVFSLSFIAVCVALVCLGRLERSKPLLHRVALCIPYVNMIIRHAVIAQTTQTFGMLLRSGIPITEALHATAETTGNYVFRNALLQALPVVERGHPLYQGLEAAGKIFPTMVIRFIVVGEKTGTLAETLEHLTKFYEAEVDYAVKDLTTSLEPILLIIIGLIVGATILSIITPIYDITGNIR